MGGVVIKNAKEHIIFAIVSVLLLSPVIQTVHIPYDQKAPVTEIVSNSVQSVCNEHPLFDIILYQGFEGEQFPPQQWEKISENSEHTWQIDTKHTYLGNSSAYCNHDSQKNPQNEWLITPSMNFTGLSEINLSFYWSMSYFWSVSPYDNYDFNIYISLDNGANWIKIWSEESVGFFENWMWYNTSMGDSIDLTPYNKYQAIRIGFQYTGIDGAQLNIDEIYVVGIEYLNPPIVDAGGPYIGYMTKDLYFYGNVTGGDPPYRWLWDFGDGYQSRLQNPIHVYNILGNYSVQLTVIDRLDVSGYDETFVQIMNMSKIPELIIKNISGPLGIEATIKNKGCIDATNITWTIHICNNIFCYMTLGTIERLKRNCCQQVKSNLFNGIGIVNVEILVNADNMHQISEQCKAIMFGKYIIPLVKSKT